MPELPPEVDEPRAEDLAAELTAMRGDETMKRVNWLPAPHYYNLNMACVVLARALEALEVQGGNSGIYLVGSSTKRRDYRDVDVRGIIDDKSWEKLFGSADFNRPDILPLWSVICSAISCWLSKQSGLPIDFQLQSMTVANGSFSRKQGHDRQPLGVFLNPTPRDYAAHEAADYSSTAAADGVDA